MLCMARYVHNRLQLASVDMYQVRHVNTSSRVPGTNHLKVCVLVSSNTNTQTCIHNHKEMVTIIL